MTSATSDESESAANQAMQASKEVVCQCNL